jgi:hypothetical protein
MSRNQANSLRSRRESGHGNVEAQANELRIIGVFDGSPARLWVDPDGLNLGAQLVAKPHRAKAIEKRPRRRANEGLCRGTQEPALRGRPLDRAAPDVSCFETPVG